MDPDQARQNVWFDMDPNCLILMVCIKYFDEKKIMKNVPSFKDPEPHTGTSQF